MLSDRPLIVDFDGSVSRQRAFVDATKARVLNMRRIGPSVRHWTDSATGGKIGKAINHANSSSAIFLGSGDFHHVSAFLIERIKVPVSVVIFDHHPDWDVFPPAFGCGAWVSRILEHLNVHKVLEVGGASRDFQVPGIFAANWKQLKSGRLALLAATERRKLPRRLAKYVAGDLAANPLEQFREQVRNLPTQDVYISIDKDCLRRSEALTNWEEGSITLDLLLAFIDILRNDRNIVGADIVGDYSKALYSHPWKRFCGFLDHPKAATGLHIAENELDLINGRTNQSIFESLAGAANESTD